MSKCLDGRTTMPSMQLDRRTVLRQTVGGVIWGVLAAQHSDLRAQAVVAGAAKSPASPSDVKHAIQGPILSIPTPFTKELKVDFEGVERMIQRGTPHGIRIVALTAGNSQYDVLTYDEIVELTQVTVAAAGPESVTISAAGDWPLEKVLQYADVAERSGASALQVMRPGSNALTGNAATSAVDEDLDAIVAHYRKIAAGTSLPLVLHGQYSHPLLERLAEIDSIVAIKEDVGLEYYIQVQRKFGERFAIFEGGPEYAYLVARPYGSPASYTTLGTFVPALTAKFWDAVRRKDMDAAYEYVTTYELPFFDHWSHAFWRASLEHFGVAQRYLRSPQTALSDAEMKDVAKFYKTLGLS